MGESHPRGSARTEIKVNACRRHCDGLFNLYVTRRRREDGDCSGSRYLKTRSEGSSRLIVEPCPAMLEGDAWRPSSISIAASLVISFLDNSRIL